MKNFEKQKMFSNRNFLSDSTSLKEKLIGID